MTMLYGVSSAFFLWLDSPSGLRPSHRGGFEISLIHTTFVRASLDRDNNHKRGTSMPQAAFEPAILASEGPQNYALHGARYP